VPTRPGEPWPDPQRRGDETTAVDEFWSLMSTYQGVRSRFFDGALLEAAAAGTEPSSPGSGGRSGSR
jgi:hypothetical protein